MHKDFTEFDTGVVSYIDQLVGIKLKKKEIIDSGNKNLKRTYGYDIKYRINFIINLRRRRAHIP